MTIELTWKENGKRGMDLAVNDEQVMEDTVRILAENHMTGEGKAGNTRLYSHRKREYINLRLTFAEAGIFNGDILELTYSRRGEGTDDVTE